MRSTNLPIEALRCFVAVAESGSVTEAGALLGRSQPAVSLQLKKLEQLLDRSLFLREARQLRLNNEGQQMLDYAQRILALNDEALASFRGPAIAGTVRFGVPSEFASTILPKVIGRFSRVNPGVSLEVTSDLSANLMRGYRQDQYDLILALHDEREKGKRSQQQFVRNEELVWVGRSEDWSSGEALPLVLAPDGCIYRKRVLRTLKKVSRASSIVYTDPDLNGIKSAIDAGLGITALARSTVPQGLQLLGNQALQQTGLPELGSISVSLLYHKNSANPAVKRLESEIRANVS